MLEAFEKIAIQLVDDYPWSKKLEHKNSERCGGGVHLISSDFENHSEIIALWRFQWLAANEIRSAATKKSTRYCLA